MAYLRISTRRARQGAPVVFAGAAVAAVIVAASVAVFTGIDTATAPVIRVAYFGLAPSCAVLAVAAIVAVRGRSPAAIGVPTALALAAIAFSTAAQSTWDADMRAEHAAPGAEWWLPVTAGVVLAASSIFSLVWVGMTAERRTPALMIVFVACSVVGGLVLMIAWAIWVTPISMAAAAVVAAAISRHPDRRGRQATGRSVPSS